MTAMEPVSTLSTARFYHSLGINVIPWKHRVKGGGQLLPSWYEYQIKRVTDAQIEEWFKEDVGIAIVTGEVSGLTVIDDDLRNGQKRLNSAVTARSGGGGYHYYFKYEPSLKTARYEDMHLEVKNNGALIYAYPTIHKSGERYTFENGIESLKNLGPVPLENDLLKQFGVKQEVDKREKNARIYNSGYLEYFEQSTGSRDEKLKEFCKEMWKKGMSEGQILSLARLVNKSYTPPLEDHIVIEKVASTFRGLGQKIDYQIAAVKPVEKPSPLISYTGPLIQVAFEKKMLQCGEGLSTGFVDIDRYFRLYPQHLYMVTAGTHIGKTTFATSIASSVARTGKKVTMFALEDGLFSVPKILKTVGDIPDTFTLVDSDSFPTPSQIMSHIEEHKADFVVIDHIHFLSSDDKKESLKDTIIDITKNLKLLTKKLNIPIMSLVHIKKQDRAKDVPPLIDDMKDAQELGGLANVVCILHRKRLEAGASGYFDDNGTLNIAKAKVPNGKLGTLSFSIKDEKFTTKPYESNLDKLIKSDDGKGVQSEVRDSKDSVYSETLESVLG